SADANGGIRGCQLMVACLVRQLAQTRAKAPEIISFCNRDNHALELLFSSIWDEERLCACSNRETHGRGLPEYAHPQPRNPAARASESAACSGQMVSSGQ